MAQPSVKGGCNCWVCDELEPAQQGLHQQRKHTCRWDWQQHSNPNRRWSPHHGEFCHQLWGGLYCQTWREKVEEGWSIWWALVLMDWKGDGAGRKGSMGEVGGNGYGGGSGRGQNWGSLSSCCEEVSGWFSLEVVLAFMVLLVGDSICKERSGNLKFAGWWIQLM